MKKLTAIFLTTFLLHANTKAQITLDTTINYQWGIGNSIYVIDIAPNESKYYVADTLTNTFSLYNIDFTPFLMNIAVPEPYVYRNGNQLSIREAIYITRTLFDCDSSNIEYLFETPSGGGCANSIYIMRTDGTQLIKIDSARAPYCFGCAGGSDELRPIRNTSSGTKLFASRLCTGDWTFQIYSLCGTLTTETFDFTKVSQQFVNVFPNPATNSITFEIHPPNNRDEFELVIVDNNAREIKRELVKDSPRFTVDVADFSNGSYIYTLCTKNKSYQNGKFIINK